MKIRSITYFCNPKYPLNETSLHAAGDFLSRARAAFQAAGFEVQTTRLASIPFPQLLGEKHLDDLPQLAAQVDALIRQIGIGHASLGPALPRFPRSYEVIPEAVAASRNVFFGGLMADKTRGVDLAAIRRCAQVIVQCASIDPNGFANLRFAALANVPAGAPFFPAAYHNGNQPGFAIATQAADLAVEAFTSSGTLQAGRRALVASIERSGAALARVARQLTSQSSTVRKSSIPIRHRGRLSPKLPAFLGIDFSLAPFPSEAHSIGTAFERLGIPGAGLHGSLAAAAILTESLGRARFPRTGFSGLFLPVLEDSVLALRAAQGTLTVKDLLLYSAVCGAGLDTIALPGDTTAEQIAALLLDVCALALRLDKPLTARLLPIPNKKAGELTDFEFEFFANSRVMALDSQGLSGLLGGQETFILRAR